MTSIELASGGSFATSSDPIPSCAVTDSSSDLRSSVTTPSVVPTNSPSSSIRAISLLCAAAFAWTQRCWTFGCSSAFRATSSAALRSAPATGRRAARAAGQALGERRLDVDVVEDRGDDEGGERVLDLGVLDQLLAGGGPGLGLEQLALGPEANTETTPMTVARTMRMAGSARRPVLFGASFSLIASPYSPGVVTGGPAAWPGPERKPLSGLADPAPRRRPRSRGRRSRRGRRWRATTMGCFRRSTAVLRSHRGSRRRCR